MINTTHPTIALAGPLLALTLLVASPAAAADKTIARAHPTAKANATGLELRHDAPPSLKAGQPVVVKLQVRGARVGDASVEVQAASPSLRLLAVDGRAPASAIALAPGTTRRIEIELELSAAADGPALVNVVMRQHGRVAITAIALNVGDATPAALKSEGPLRTTPQGEAIVAMPASR